MIRHAKPSILAAAFAAAALFPSGAQPSEPSAQLRDLQGQMARMQQQLEALASHNRELEERLNRYENGAAPAPEQPAPAVDDGKEAVQSSMGMDIYGYLKFDMSYDTSQTGSSNFVRWVKPENANGGDDQFNATANQSRFGLRMRGPDAAGAKTGGKVEVDFYGGGPENKAKLMMRHAYVEMDWKDMDLVLLAGQTFDVVSPLSPSTVNYPVQWWAGNIGYRRPQLRLEKGIDLGGGREIRLQGAMSRTIGDLPGFNDCDAGEDSGFPTLQGRAAYAFPVWDGRRAEAGVSGHWGQEEYDQDQFGNHDDFDTYSANLDLAVPLLEWLWLKGELWTGKNLDAYLGGIGQGVNLAAREEIRASGGWAALSLDPWDRWRFNLGYSIDNPEDGALPAGSRSKNESFFANAMHSIHESLIVGLELSRWETDYTDSTHGDNWRIQTAITYSF